MGYINYSNSYLCINNRGKRHLNDDDDIHVPVDDIPANNSHVETGSYMALNYGTDGGMVNAYESPADGDTNATPARPGE